LLAARLSFPETEKVLKEMTGVEITSRQIETIAEQVGAEAERRQKQQDQLSSSQPLAVRVGPKGESVRKFVVEMDGVQVGLQDGRWQEVKCGIVYELGQRVEISEGRCELIESQRCALRGEVKDLRKRLWSMCVKAGIREEDRIIVIGDGAEWIEQTAQHLFPGSVRILDYYHASERISDVAGARWGEGSKKAKEWREQKQKELKEGEVEKVIGSMKRLKMRGEGEETRRGAIRYMEKRKEEMRYGEWRKEGIPIGSGAIESSCKQIVSARCKQAGMRWSEEGVDSILALRCLVINGRIDELCPKPEISIEWKKAA